MTHLSQDDYETMSRMQQTRENILEAFLRDHPEADQDDVKVYLSSMQVEWNRPDRDQLAVLTFDVEGTGTTQ